MDPTIDAEAEELVKRVLEQADQPITKKDGKASLTKLTPSLASQPKRSLSKRRFGWKRS